MGILRRHQLFNFVLWLLILLVLEGFFTVSAQDPSPTQVLMPTVTPDRVTFLRIRDLMINNGECKLPCFWGFSPEEATPIEIDDLISSLGAPIRLYQVDGQTGHNAYWTFRPSGRLNVGFSISDDNNQLNQTSVTLIDPQIWLPKSVFELSEVLKSLGVPTEVFIVIAGPPLRYNLVVLYNDQGVMLRYDVDIEYDPLNLDVDAPLNICPSVQETRFIDVWLQHPDSEELVEQHQPDLRDADRSIRPFWPLERITGMTAEEFTEFFVENPQGCIEAPSLASLRETGYQY